MSKWIAEFELEDGNTMPEHMDLVYKGARIDFHCKPLDQEAIDHKAQYENYLKKSEVVISQLRTDRDKLRDAFDKVKAEIKALSPEPTAYDVVDGNPIKDAVWETLADVLQIVDKYRTENRE